MSATLPNAASSSASQLEFPLDPELSAAAHALSLRARFEEFHAANPEVFTWLRAEALRLQERGVKRYGMKGLFEVLRWQRALATQGAPWKLNNILTPYYARLVMQDEPRLQGFFELRRVREVEDAV